MLGENPIRAIKNGQSRYIGNIVHKIQNEGKQENKQITQKILMISNTTLQFKTGVDRGDRECKQFLILRKKPVVARTYSQVR